MIGYRAYIIGDDGHVNNYRAYKSANDTEAVVWAKQLGDGHDVELWSGRRFIIQLEHEKGKTALVGASHWGRGN